MRQEQQLVGRLLEAIRTERQSLAERREVIESLERRIDALAEVVGDAEVLLPLRSDLATLRRQCVQQWSERLGAWASRMEELAVVLSGMVELANLGELSASVAHEIRNPLCGMLLSVEVLQTKMDEDDSRKVLLDNLHREAERMEKVVHNLLHFARHYTPRIAECDMEEVVHRTTQSIRSSLRKRNVEVRVRRSALHCSAQIDSDLVEQVFSNILLNAVDASPPGSRVEVDLDVLEEEGAVAVSFTDQGDGIADDLLARVFDPFFTSKATGIGLGLSVSKKIVDAHKGRLEVRNAPSGGAVFTVVLPAEAAEAEEKAAA